MQLTFTQYTKFVLINETSPMIPRLAFCLLEFEELAAEVSEQTQLIIYFIQLLLKIKTYAFIVYFLIYACSLSCLIIDIIT